MGKDSSKTGRREILSRGVLRAVELASAVPLLYFLVKNCVEGRKYYSVDMGPANYGEAIPTSKFLQMGNDFARSLHDLVESYRAEYLKTETTTRPCFDSEGDLTTCTDTHSVWRVPSDLPDNYIVGRWNDDQQQLQERCEKLGKVFIDPAKLKDVRFVEKTTSKAYDMAVGSAIYGGAIALLIGYEEAIAALTYRGYAGKTLDDKVREKYTPSQIKRRSFLKLPVALVGATVSSYLMNLNKEEGAKGKEKLERRIIELSNELNVTDEASFVRYFCKTQEIMMSNLAAVIYAAGRSLSTSIESDSIRNAFLAVKDSGEKYLAEMKDFFRNGVPQELATLTNAGYLSEQIGSSSSREKVSAHMSVVVEGLAVVGTMAVLVVPAEILNQRME